MKSKILQFKVDYLILFIFCLFCIYPSFYEFVGTDIGVYYEISSRLFVENNLSLFENYWDHKPLLIYLWFYPFHVLDFSNYSVLGLRTGTLALLYLNAALMYHYLKSIINNFLPEAHKIFLPFLLVPVFFYCSLAYGEYDFSLNGILNMASLALELAGILASYYYVEFTTRGNITLMWSGFMLGTAPFFRPTAFSGIYSLIFLIVISSRSSKLRSYVFIAISSLLTIGLWLSITFWLGTDPGTWFSILVVFNTLYASIYNTPVIDFLQFNKSFYTLSGFLIALVLLALLQILTLGGLRKKYFSNLWHRNKPIIGLYIVCWCWSLTEMAISLILQRKIMGYYLIQPLFAVYLISFISCFLISYRSIKCIIGTMILFLAPVIFNNYISYHYTPTEIYNNRFGSQDDLPTAKVIELIKSQHDMTWKKRLFIFGNRANLYTMARQNGICSYSWVTYANLLTLSNQIPIINNKINQFKQNFYLDPPEYIVVVYNNTQNKSMDMENIYYQASAYNEARWIRVFINEKYTKIATITSDIKAWPSNYSYNVYKLKNYLGTRQK